MKLKPVLILNYLVLFFSPLIANQTYFEDYCQSGENWQIFDFSHNAYMRAVNDITVPSGFGPKVLELTGTDLIALANDSQMRNGYWVALMKTSEPNLQEFFGGLLVGTKQTLEDGSGLSGYWLQQDFQTGCQLRFCNPEGEDSVLIERPGVGLLQDRSWNQAAYFWQKVKIEDARIYAKFWSVVSPEPEEWMLSTVVQQAIGGRFGIKIRSGAIRLAYFKTDTSDIKIPPPRMTLFTDLAIIYEDQFPTFTLFTNFPELQSNLKLNLTVRHGNNIFTNRIFNYKINKNFQRLIIPAGNFQNTLFEPHFALEAMLKEGVYEFQAIILDSSSTEIGRAVQKCVVQKDVYKEKLQVIKKRLSSLQNRLEQKKTQEQNWQSDQIAVAQCLALIEIAVNRLQQHQTVAAQHALEYADQALDRADKLPTIYPDISEFKLEFTDVQLSQVDLIAGDSLTVTIDWKITGKTVLCNWGMRLSLVDESGQTIFEIKKLPEKPLSQWTPDKIYKQNFEFDLPKFFKNNVFSPLRSGWCRLKVAVFDPDNPEKTVALDNPESLDITSGMFEYELSRIFIHNEDVRLKKIGFNSVVPGENLPIEIWIQSHASATRNVECHLRLFSEAGTIIYETGKKIGLRPKSVSKVQFQWRQNYVGTVILQVQIGADNMLLTQAERTLSLPSPEGYDFQVERGDSVVNKNEEFQVPLRFTVFRPVGTNRTDTVNIKIFAGKDEFTNETFFLKPNVTELEREIRTWPFWGDYRIRVQFNSGENMFCIEKNIVATVVEARDRRIFVNGEPFIIKGINWNNPFPKSRNKTEFLVKYLKSLGFNMLKSEPVPHWQLHLAEKCDIGWMINPLFSSASQYSVFSGFETDAIDGMQEVIRQVVLSFKNESAILFWNSESEMKGDVEAVISQLYPCLKNYDPYSRPAGSGDQNGNDFVIGQDWIGANFYFSSGQTALSRLPLVKNSLLKAFEQEKPMILTAYNFKGGVSEKAGSEAISVLWHENLKAGTSGGFFSHLSDTTAQFPCLMDSKGELRFSESLSCVFKRLNDDVQVTATRRKDETLYLTIKNIRPFTIRQIQLSVTIRDYSDQFYLTAEIPPEKSIVTTISVPKYLVDVPLILTGLLKYETHFGLQCQTDFQLLYIHE